MLAALISQSVWVFFAISPSGHIEAGCSVKNGIFLSVLSGWREAGLCNRDFYFFPPYYRPTRPKRGSNLRVSRIDRAESMVPEMLRGDLVRTCEPNGSYVASLQSHRLHAAGE